MKKYFGVLILLLLFIQVKSFSQSRDSLIKVYNNETIYQYGNVFMKGNQRLTYAELGSEFYTPSTRIMYIKSKRRLLIKRLLNVATIGVIVASIIIKPNFKGSIPFAIGSAVFGLGSSYYQAESTKYIERAIWERNRDILVNNFH
jgi:hypothetical protein